jgi:thiol-disulfide isomerase/thioredoxin
MNKAVVIVAALALAAALGFMAQRRFHAPADAQIEAQATVPQSAASAAGATAGPPAGEAARTIPEILPVFELADRDGRKRKLSDWSGRPLMVNFWATWCGPCRREIPLLNKVRAERAAQKVEIIGVAVDFRDDVLAYAQTTPIDYPLLIGEDDGLAAVQAFGMQPNFPFTVFSDSKGRIVTLKVGELHQEDIDLMLDNVLAVDAGTLQLPAARERISEGLKDNATKRAAKEANSPKLAAN